MRYLANASSDRVRSAMRAGLLGQLVTPAEGRRPLPGVWFGADNGCFGKGYPGDAAWLEWLDQLPRERCLFAVAPDVVGDAPATLERSAPMLPRVRALGFPAALVAQDGLELLEVPWNSFDVLFLGGSTAWKLSPAAAGLVVAAHARGKRVHAGRVNSRRRFLHFELLGVESADGTCLAFGPDVNLRRVCSWQEVLA